jgi:hypothetical protein
MEKRFAAKLFKLETWELILSDLASYQPKRSSLNVSKVHNRLSLSIPLDEDAEASDLNPEEKKRRRRSFWHIAAQLSSGNGGLRLKTYYGEVSLSNANSAKAFGQELYFLLSSKQKKIVDHNTILKLFATHYNTDEDVIQEHNDPEKSMTILGEQAQIMFEEARKLFDPLNLGVFTEANCINAVLTVYKEHRFAASSLNDYGALHLSLRYFIDGLYWLVMLFAMQGFLGINIFNYFIPFITLFLTLSFALGPVLGNTFLAFAFVFLQAPIDVGNRICVGPLNNPLVVGFVQSITLFHTSINSLRNELVSERVFMIHPWVL